MVDVCCSQKRAIWMMRQAMSFCKRFIDLQHVCILVEYSTNEHITAWLNLLWKQKVAIWVWSGQSKYYYKMILAVVLHDHLPSEDKIRFCSSHAGEMNLLQQHTSCVRLGGLKQTGGLSISDVSLADILLSPVGDWFQQTQHCSQQTKGSTIHSKHLRGFWMFHS